MKKTFILSAVLFAIVLTGPGFAQSKCTDSFGLSLTYDIVKARDGELNVQTTESEGSIFIILIPTA
ncbi:MAG: hypothetical protein K2U26_01985 [Cyclobacteriaceae bacterium]|nr:hypothetical protein [Cyclobacteriaceae bacterium]